MHGQQNVFSVCLFLILTKQSRIFYRIYDAAKLLFSPRKTRYSHSPFLLAAVPRREELRNSGANVPLKRDGRLIGLCIAPVVDHRNFLDAAYRAVRSARFLCEV